MNEPTLLNNSAQSSAKSKVFFFPSKMTCYWLHSSLLAALPSFPTGMIYDPWSAASVWSTQASCLWVKTEPACVYVWGCVCSSVWPRRTRRLTKEISEAPLATVFPWECSLKGCTSSNGGWADILFQGKGGWGHKNNRVWEKMIKPSSGGPRGGWSRIVRHGHCIEASQKEAECFLEF